MEVGGAKENRPTWQIAPSDLARLGCRGQVGEEGEGGGEGTVGGVGGGGQGAEEPPKEGQALRGDGEEI